MARLVGVHGIGNQQLGRHQMLSSWIPALADGLERAVGRRVDTTALDLAFYGDLFLPPAPADGTPISKGDIDVSSVLEALSAAELAELTDMMADVVSAEDLAASAQKVEKGYSRVPRPVQVLLSALDHRFGPSAGVLYIGVLRQVRRYLIEPDLKAKIDERVKLAIQDDCRVLIGHSLGSVIAYEYIRQQVNHSVELLLTLGSPLGLRIVRDRLVIQPIVAQAWINIRDPRDPVACVGSLQEWWPQIVDRAVDNGGDSHRAERYLSKAATGAAVIGALPELVS